MLGLKKKKKENEDWKKLKKTIDTIFSSNEQVHKKMSNFLKQYCGEIWDEKKLGTEDSRAYINKLFSVVSTTAPILSDNRPITHVIPHYPFLTTVAQAYNNALRYLWNILDMDMQVHRATLDAMIMGLGIFKIYFDAEKRHGGELACEIIDPREFFIAPGYDEIWKAPYCGERSLKPLSWIRANFPDAPEVNPEQELNNDMPNPIKYGDVEEHQLSTKFATVYQVWVRDDSVIEELVKDEEGKEEKVEKPKYPNGKFQFFTKDVFLEERPSDFQHGLPPYVELWDYIVPHNFIGMGECDQIEGLNKELNIQLQKLMSWARNATDPNKFIDANSGMDVEHYKETHEKGGQCYTVNSFTEKNPVEIDERGSLNEGVPLILQMLPEVIEEQSGVTDIRKGMTSKKQRQTASEMAILLESSHTRERPKVRNLEWALKRVCYLLVSNMQQFYSKPRRIHWFEDDNIVHGMIGNSRAQAENMLMSEDTRRAQTEISEKGATTEGNIRLTPDQQMEVEDTKEFLAAFGDVGEFDPLYFSFDIEIQTNSTLPLDKQSQANNSIRLYQLHGIDRKALLETIQFPNGEAIAKRMDKAEQAQKQKPIAPPQVMPGVQGGNG